MENKASLFNGWYVRQRKPVIRRARVHSDSQSKYQKKGRPAKLTENQVRAIIALKPEKTPYWAKAIALAQLLGISPTVIQNIWSGRTWRHIERSRYHTNAQYGRSASVQEHKRVIIADNPSNAPINEI